jgi:3D (Asp-Asp-Asp) domain-containing protein
MRNCSLLVSIALLVLTLSASALGGVNGKNTKLNTVIKTEAIAIRPPVHFEFNDALGAGKLYKKEKGSPGSVRRTYRILLKNGKRVMKTLLKEERLAPEPVLFQMGRSGFNATRGSFVRRKVLSMHASAYDASPATIGPGATGRTATGRHAEYGVVAVDPRVIPLNTVVYVEGYGFALACDKGSAIKGSRIDLCFDSRYSALRYGRKRVRVHILG